LKTARNWITARGLICPAPVSSPCLPCADFDLPEGPQLHDARMSAALEALSADCDYHPD
jgi:chromosome partitioning protein